MDKYSLVKASHTKLFNLSIDKAKGNEKPKIKLSITQLNYLMNIFIPFLETMEFKSKKKFAPYGLDDFKFIVTLIYQGKHLKSEIKDLILGVSYNMNNFRLSTNKFPSYPVAFLNSDVLDNVNITNFSNSDLTAPDLILKPIVSKNTPITSNFITTPATTIDKEILINQPPIFVDNNEGERININTGKKIKDVYVIEVENTEKVFTIYPTILDCAKALGFSRFVVSTTIKTGNILVGTNIVKIRKIPVFRDQDIKNKKSRAINKKNESEG